ncbi:hypothetical protein HQ587_10330 [bacterium]|nr:hypothetical protein [bacterium]
MPAYQSVREYNYTTFLPGFKRNEVTCNLAGIYLSSVIPPGYATLETWRERNGWSARRLIYPIVVE